ncbi:SulP family inorganic anion transporter [Candidatus Nitronereus thalassa]|uniref:SulP family inorganic anion transporter n=1 Tax=Candidatus Nitronereus thalassa TaxID=3020898 RepID=A0ABU3K7J6_9BACT|nr:SulP family inorganic anion transporter [Candidatus Nitronereus thalassa]MDT7042351.1 SulP family inorganic anion transporter [Candidatus Nitronereus thalassa]
MTFIHGLHFNNLRGDIYGGVVAAVVALPLALAFGVASGVGAIAGLYGAIFLGFFAALFGGTPAQASGPTGPMTVVVAGLFSQLGEEPALVFTIIILGGGLQILLGFFGVGRFIALVPYPVISGFMSGIGGIILILQVGPLMGHAAMRGGVLPNLMAIPEFVSDPNVQALFAGLITLAIVYFTPSFIGNIVPPTLLALLAGSLATFYFFPSAPLIGHVPGGFPFPIIPTLHMDGLVFVIEGAMVLALLGSIDSLLTSLVADNMTRTHHDSNRELIGQGIGNMVCGLFGGLPGAGATMRTVANIQTGGRTPISGMTMALVLLAVLLGLGPMAEQIPLAVLAGLLFKVGLDIIDWRFLRHVFQAPRADVLIMAVVFLVTVLVDLVTAVGVGIVMASVLFVKEMADLELANLRVITGTSEEAPLSRAEQAVLDRNKGKIVLIHVDGPMSFGSAKNMVRRLERIPELRTFKSVVLDLSDVPMIDGTAALAIEDMLRMIQFNKQHLFFSGMHPKVAEVLDGLGVLNLIRPGHRYAFRLDALQHAAHETGSTHPDDMPQD